MTDVRGWRSDEGQDVVEYALILGFVALAGAAVLTGMSGTIDAVWNIVNSRLSSAAN